MDEMKNTCGHHGHKKGPIKLILGAFLLIWGIVDLGNYLGWWLYKFPFFPIALIVVALVMLIHGVKKTF